LQWKSIIIRDGIIGLQFQFCVCLFYTKLGGEQLIEIKKLTKQFKEATSFVRVKSANTIYAVKEVELTVNQGEVLGLLGENGAGKTTTLRMLATMLKPTSGTAVISGTDILNEPEQVRNKIGILFGGEVGLYDKLTARENIEYFGQLNNMTQEQIDSRIEELVRRFEIGEYIDRRVGKFSKGMKQKVSIARSIVHDPEVMLFDEPTSGLDVTASRVVHQFIKDCREENKTIIFSSHSMAEVEKLCDRIAIINKGQILFLGTIDELKQNHGDDNLEDIFVGLVGEGQ
jgi:sodium transport system ATP-binding protein